MTALLERLGAITLFVDNVPRAKAFYQDVLGLTVVNEDPVSAAFNFGNTIINLLNVSEGPGLIGPAKVGARDSGSRVQLTVWVKDADAICNELGKRGVTLLNGPMNREWGMRTACFTDPDGHVWEIAQELNPSSAQ